MGRVGVVSNECIVLSILTEYVGQSAVVSPWIEFSRWYGFNGRG